MKKITLEPVTLESSSVKLIPLSPVHTADLQEAVLDGGLHRLWYTMIPSVDGVPEEIERRLALHSSGSMIPFSVFYKPMKKVVGMTTYMNIDIDNKRIEIGST
ncbi:N-acetyltransferase, partial [Candidatus Poribacteria bacterium]|nr:N-acetyltransferase [Candidatus Poribacteria bacterium]